MNKNELIELKNKLMNELKYKKYGTFSAYYGGNPNKTENVEDIKSKIETQEVIEKLEIAIEKFLRDLIYQGIEFDKIVISIPHNIYVSEFFLRKNINNVSPRKDLQQQDLLSNLLSVDVALKAFNNGNYVTPKNKDENHQKSFLTGDLQHLGIVECDEFIAEIEALGYDISPKTFNEIVNNIITRKSDDIRITIDLSKDKKYNR